MKLLIVESPAKAKTITKYLDNKYTVKASIGHIRDLPKSATKAIDIKGGFVPHYEISPGKEKTVAELKNLVNKSDEIVLATDPDREGEAIAWHLIEALGLEDSKKDVKRITFNEITESAVKKAIEYPRKIDLDLVDAQQARRVLDRLFGYGLSGLIWKKVRYGLSAGRVQSPALRILMEKEREIRAFIPETFWTITADVKKALQQSSGQGSEKFTLTCVEEPRDQKEVERILDVGKKSKWSVIDIKETEQKRSPREPFITSTLQQTASTRLGFAPSRTMGVAQKLYEAGLITYMRTDSPALSKEAQEQIITFAKKEYGAKYVTARVFKSKSKSAQEAHEAIRPSDIFKKSAGLTDEQKQLYKLIWQRTVASQMADANMLRTKITAKPTLQSAPRPTGVGDVVNKEIPNFEINGSRTLFDGWLKADAEARGEDIELPKVIVGDKLDLLDINSEEKQTQPPNRYTEAGLIKELEKRGIGRPSTYASIIKTIVDRGYVEKQGKTLIPTDTGDVVSSFLEKHFDKYISDSFTAEMEDNLDKIAEGKRKYLTTMKDFYTPFTKDVKSKADIEKLTTLGEADPNIKCPICGADMVIKLSRAGKFLSCSKFPECNGARTIGGKELEGPKETGEDCPKCGSKLIERDGRFGRFVACSKYPKCKFIKQSEEEEAKKRTGVKCPKCVRGEMTERRGRFGVFYSCSDYPTCKYAIKAKPTGKLCTYKNGAGIVCGELMMEGTKTIPERCSNKSCPNHNPHKVKK